MSNLLQQRPVELLFLDIQMPHLTGIKFLRSIPNLRKVIFTTAYKQYAIEGSNLDVLILQENYSWRAGSSEMSPRYELAVQAKAAKSGLC